MLAGYAKAGGVTLEDECDVNVCEASWEVDRVEHGTEVTKTGDVVATELLVELHVTPKHVQRAAAVAFPTGAEIKVGKKTMVLLEIEAAIERSRPCYL